MLRRALIAQESRARSEASAASSRDGDGAAPFKRPKLGSEGLPKRQPNQLGSIGLGVAQAFRGPKMGSGALSEIFDPSVRWWR